MNIWYRGWVAISSGCLLGLLAASASGQWPQVLGSDDISFAKSVVGRTSAPDPVLEDRYVHLSDGRALTIALDGSEVSLVEVATRKIKRSWAVSEGRRRASLTALPSGRVLIWGGEDRQGNLLSNGLLFDPELNSLQETQDILVAPRAGHTATVLTDGRVLFVGGRGDEASYQTWDEVTDTVTTIKRDRFDSRGHSAKLQADGRVRLFGGISQHRKMDALLFDPSTGSLEATGTPEVDPSPGLAASLPSQGADQVSTTARLSIRFTQLIRSGDITASTVTLIGPGGSTPIHVVPAESGRLVFVTPRQELFPGTTYTLLVNGIHTIQDKPVPLIAVDFQTASSGSGREEIAIQTPRKPSGAWPDSYCDGRKSSAAPCQSRATLKDGVWTPGEDSTGGRWRVTGRQPTLRPARSMAWLSKVIGVTTLSGQIRQVDGVPVPNVEVTVGSIRARTNVDGEFTLVHVPAGRQELYVDGTTANANGREYGQFVVGVDIDAGKLTQLPYTMYLPRITARDKMSIDSPTKRDITLTHPDMPGLMVHIPEGTVFRDRKGRIVRELSIVPTPVNRAPFPVAQNYPMYFTLEPGGAVIQGLTPEAATGVKIFYPNYDGYPVGTQADFWIYDPSEGWRVYGQGRVTSNGRVFSPEAGVALHQTMGGSLSIGSGEDASEEEMPPDCQQCGEGNAGTGSNATAGDPIDLRTGRFSYAETDIAIQDVVPIVLGRNYRPFDRNTQDFGIGTASSYHYRLYSVPGTNFNTVKLVLPNGVPLYFIRGSGSDYTGIWRHYGTTSASGATMQLAGDYFVVSMPDSSTMAFYKSGSNPLYWIQDRHGNRTEFIRDAGLISKIVSPSGRWIELDRDGQNRIIEAWDSIGNTWQYQYNAHGYLSKVVYPDESEKLYAYDAIGYNSSSQVWYRWLTEVTDRRGNRLLKNEFGSGAHGDPGYGKVVKQTLADGAIYEMDYAHLHGATTGVLVTHPDGSRRRVVFDPNSKYPLSDTLAFGTSLQQTFTFERDSHGRMTARVDPLGRRTEYGYNGIGQVIDVTYLAGTPESVGVSVAYNTDNQPASITDSIGRTTSLVYENGCLVRITNALGKHIHLTCNAAGQPTGVTDALNNVVTLHYDGYDLTAATDPMGRSVQFRYDLLGRVVATEDALGNLTRQEYDAEGRVVKLYDAANRITELAYDPNGNVSAVLMPHENGITYVYDSRDRLIERTDSLDQSESWTYDTMSRVTSYTDRKSQTTTFTYDALGRSATTTYHDSSVVTSTYDAGDRLLSLADTATGTLGWVYDDLDRVIQAITLQGNIAYEYDDAGRRTAMTAASQPRIEYQYDSGDRLRRILQGSEVYEFEYDDLNRLIEQTLPNGIQTGYAYNAASQLTGIAWLKPDTTLLHDLGYGYNSVGQRVAQTGSLAPQLLPVASAGNTFDDNNRQTAYGGQSLTYDANGNLTGDGTHTFHWNARNQLVEIKQGAITVASFGYDVLGRRFTKTEGSTTVEYLHDGLDPVQETRGAAVEPILTGLGIDERYARGSGTNRRYFLTDGLGSTRLLTDTNGAIANRYEYDPYGGTTQTNPSVQNGYRYTGREQDANGLYYYRARYYHPGMGRFIAEDPLHLAAGDLNVYAYVFGDPLSYTDPTGEFAWGLAFAGANLALQLYQNGGNLKCVNWGEVGLSMLGGGLLNGLLKGAFKFKTAGSHGWSATKHWMKKQGIHTLSPGQQRHHWFFQQNQGWFSGVSNSVKNQPWNLNPISSSFNGWLGRHPNLAWMGAPSWAPEVLVGGATAAFGPSGGGCGCE